MTWLFDRPWNPCPVREPTGLDSTPELGQGEAHGTISHITVNANSAGQAKQLALAQFGGQIDVLSVTRS